MKNVSVIIFVLFIVLILGLFLVSYQVRETEKVLITTFGKPTKVIEEPGLQWKLPPPFQRVHRFDSRTQLFRGAMEETTTRGGEPILVSSYVVWKIGNPQEFLERVKDQKGAENYLRSLLRSTQNEVIGEHYFSEFINSNSAHVKFGEIEGKMTESLKAKAADAYSINIVAVGIRQLGVSEKVTENVFARMRADRQRKTEAILSEGNAEATKIRTDAESKRTELLAIVEAEAKMMRGEGDAEAAKYYKLLDEDPEFAMFLRNIEALKTILAERSTIVLSADSEPMKLLKDIPDIQPKR
jgi:membrane protease subunit HflC